MAQESRISDAKKKRMVKIIEDLKGKMSELDKLKEEISGEEISFSISPKKTKIILEEIKVPSLEVLKDESKKTKR